MARLPTPRTSWAFAYSSVILALEKEAPGQRECEKTRRGFSTLVARGYTTTTHRPPYHNPSPLDLNIIYSSSCSLVSLTEHFHVSLTQALFFNLGIFSSVQIQLFLLINRVFAYLPSILSLLL